MPVIGSWTGGDADLLRQSLRMTNESFAEYLGVAVRTVAYWRKQPAITPMPAIQETLDAALERAPDRAKAQFALLAERGNRTGSTDSSGVSDSRAFVPGASSPPAAQEIPRQRLPPDDIDDLLAHVTVTSIGGDVIQQIEQAAVFLAESHTQAPARKLLGQVMPLHRRVRSLLDGRLLLSQQRDLYRIESLLLSHACLLLGDLNENDLAERYGMAGLAFAREAGADQAVAMTALSKTFRWQKRLTESMNMARTGFACSPDAPIRVQLASQEANAAALLGDAGRAREALARAERAAESVSARFRAVGLVVPDHPASSLHAVRGDATRRCGRDAGGCVSSRCRLVGGNAEDPGELGANTRRRGDSAPDERVAGRCSRRDRARAGASLEHARRDRNRLHGKVPAAPRKPPV